MKNLLTMVEQLQEFSYGNLSAQMKKSNEWSNDSINFFREIARTSLIYFVPMRYVNECLHGEISYVQEKSLSKILRDNNFAMRK